MILLHMKSTTDFMLWCFPFLPMYSTKMSVHISTLRQKRQIYMQICCIDSMPEITLNNCHLKDSTIVSTGGARVGGLIAQTGKTALAHSNLYGRFVPNSTGKLTIDGVAISN